MRRTKAAVSVEVKQVIGALCRLLAACGLEVVPPPETFRRAKFGGGPEVEEQFWQLLANILRAARIVSCEDEEQLRGELRRLVAAGLWQTGYHANWLWYGEDGEGGDGRSSYCRDLLLALGWLLAAGALEKLLTQRVQRLDKTLLTPTHVDLQLPSQLQVDAASVRKLQWLIGRLRFQGRSLLSVQEERARLLHAVLFTLLSSSVSTTDQSSSVLKEDCVCMLQLCDLLEAYLNWKQVEKVFWTWMDSVVDLMDTVDKKATLVANRSAKVCRHGHRGLEMLDDMVSSLPTGRKGQRRATEAAVDRVGQVKSRGGSDNLLSPFPLMPSFPQVYRAKLETEKPVKGCSRAVEGQHAGTGDPDELLSSQAAQLLRQKEALLLERRDRQRLANRTHVQDLISGLEDLVLIPP